jgi:cell division protein FtsB
MDSLFYRKEKKGRLVRPALKRLVRNKKALLLICFGIIALSFIFFNDHGVLQRISLQHQKVTLTKEIQLGEQETKDLQAQLKALEGDRSALERVAREKYGMVRDGETVYKVHPKK